MIKANPSLSTGVDLLQPIIAYYSFWEVTILTEAGQSLSAGVDLLQPVIVLGDDHYDRGWSVPVSWR